MATRLEGLVVALTAALADTQARIEAATSAGVDISLLRRKLAQIESDLAAAKKKAIEEFHRVPSNPYA